MKGHIRKSGLGNAKRPSRQNQENAPRIVGERGCATASSLARVQRCTWEAQTTIAEAEDIAKKLAT